MKTSVEIAYSAVFVALLIGCQLALAALPNVEVVTVLLCAWSFVNGITKGMITATAFSLIRCFVFGFFPSVICLYLVYYNLLAFVFALLGKYKSYRSKITKIVLLTVCAAFLTACFTLLDDLITPLIYGFNKEGFKAYFISSLPFMGVGVACSSLSMLVLFLPLEVLFNKIKP